MSAHSNAYRIVAQSEEERELYRTQTNACLMTDESLRVTREMLRVGKECEDAGAATLSMLHAQGEQLGRTDAALGGIHVGLKAADDDLIKMERTKRYCCGGCFKGCCLSWSRSKEKNRQIWEKDVTVSKAVVKNETRESSPHQRNSIIPRITNDAKEDEMESNMQGISNMMGNMKHIAISMGTEIRKQNDDIDSISQKTHSNEIRINSAQKKANYVLKS